MDSHGHSGPDPEPWAVFERSRPGWWRVTLLEGAELHVGVSLASDGRPVITGLVVFGRPLTAADLRKIPLRRIEASMGHPRRRAWIKEGARAASPLTPLRDANGDPDPEDEVPPRLTRPDGKDPDAFYRAVAETYRYEVTRSHRPAAVIAESVGVPVGTARRWINRARELGLLEKGQKGRAMS